MRKQPRNLLKTNKAEEPVKDAERMLAQAEKLIAKLQSKVADQQQTIRELRSQAKLADNITAELSELKAEVTRPQGRGKGINPRQPGACDQERGAPS